MAGNGRRNKNELIEHRIQRHLITIIAFSKVRFECFCATGTSLEEMIVTSPQQAYKSLTARAKDRETFFNSHRGWLPSDLELEMLDHGGAFIFPSDPVMMRYKTFQQQFGRQPFR